MIPNHRRDEGFGARPISELDEIRRRMEQSLRGIHVRLVLDVVFTADDYGATVAKALSAESIGAAGSSH